MKPDLAKLLEAVEQDWGPSPMFVDERARLEADVGRLVAALRAARDSGAVPVLLSREAVESLRKASKDVYDSEGMDYDCGAYSRLVKLLAREPDLSAVLEAK
jgi:hypothetical protein